MIRILALGALLLAAVPGPALSEAAPETGVLAACLAATPYGDDPACIFMVSNQCQHPASDIDTRGIVRCIATERDAWNAIMEDEYRQTEALFARLDADAHTEQRFVEKLRIAQSLWLLLREKDCEVAASLAWMGTILPIEVGTCQLRMTARRAVQLRDMRGEMR